MNGEAIYIDTKLIPNDKEGGAEETGQSPQAVNLVGLTDDLDLFHNESKEAFVAITFEKHIEIWPLVSQRFKD